MYLCTLLDMATCVATDTTTQNALFDDPPSIHVPRVPPPSSVRSYFVDELVSLLSKAAKAFQRKGGKFKAALVEGHVSWASVVPTLSRLRGLGSRSIDGRTTSRKCTCACGSAWVTSRRMPLFRCTEEDTSLISPRWMTMSMLSSLSVVKGAPLSTSCLIERLLRTDDIACLSGSCWLTCCPSRGHVRACWVLIGLFPFGWHLGHPSATCSSMPTALLDARTCSVGGITLERSVGIALTQACAPCP